MKTLTIVKFVGVLALALGFGIALLGLTAPFGVWIGVWDFRRGFDLLRKAHDFALWFSLAALILALVVVAVGLKQSQSGLVRLAILALIGAGVGSLTYFIPETFRAPEGENYPPIHDISTDTVTPPTFVAVLPLRANAANTVVYGGSEGMTPEKLAELQKQAYPDIQPWQSNESKQVVFEKALAAVQQLGWDLVDQNFNEGRIEATDTTLWFRFKDDVVVIVTESNGMTTVNARSVSRVGRGDVGANAKRLRKFFSLLSE